jgi:hypothetical protein
MAALQIHERLTELKMRLLGDRVSRGTAWKLAREHDWDSLREAEYHAIARLQADALVTIDPGQTSSAFLGRGHTRASATCRDGRASHTSF